MSGSMRNEQRRETMAMGDFDAYAQDKQENSGTSLQAIIHDLARAKAMFQQRAILAAMDVMPQDTANDTTKGRDNA